MSGLNGMGKQVERLEERAPKPPEPEDDLSTLTSRELYDLLHTIKLEEALERGDLEAAARYQRRLATSDDELRRRFLALDERTIPTFEQGAPQVREEHIIYSLTRVNFRSTRICFERLRTEGLRSGDRDEMWMWLDQYAGSEP